MGLFDGINEAELFERGRYLPPGFRGVLEVKRTIAKETVRSGIGFIVEFEVVRVDRPGQGYNDGDAANNVPRHELAPVVRGEKRTWFQKMGDKTVAFPSIKAWAAAMSGYASHEKEAIENEVAPHLEGVLTHATDNPADNDFVGCRVEVETIAHKTKKSGSDFTIHNWIPWEDPDEPEPRDAVDEITG